MKHNVNKLGNHPLNYIVADIPILVTGKSELPPCGSLLPIRRYSKTVFPSRSPQYVVTASNPGCMYERFVILPLTIMKISETNKSVYLYMKNTCNI